MSEAQTQLNLPDKERTMVQNAVDAVRQSLGEKLESAAVFGPAARGETLAGVGEIDLVFILKDLNPQTLDALSECLRPWHRRTGQVPHLFTANHLRHSSDSFPIEISELHDCRVILHGRDFGDDLSIRADHLRLQCERGITENLMLLRAGYVLVASKPRRVGRLMALSCESFAMIFRAVARLAGKPTAKTSWDTTKQVCDLAGMDFSVFEAVYRLRKPQGFFSLWPKPEKDLFSRYYRELEKAQTYIDRLPHTEQTIGEVKGKNV